MRHSCRYVFIVWENWELGYSFTYTESTGESKKCFVCNYIRWLFCNNFDEREKKNPTLLGFSFNVCKLVCV